jgi:hypothetical protein
MISTYVEVAITSCLPPNRFLTTGQSGVNNRSINPTFVIDRQQADQDDRRKS